MALVAVNGSDAKGKYGCTAWAPRRRWWTTAVPASARLAHATGAVVQPRIDRWLDYSKNNRRHHEILAPIDRQPVLTPQDVVRVRRELSAFYNRD